MYSGSEVSLLSTPEGDSLKSRLITTWNSVLFFSPGGVKLNRHAYYSGPGEAIQFSPQWSPSEEMIYTLLKLEKSNYGPDPRRPRGAMWSTAGMDTQCALPKRPAVCCMWPDVVEATQNDTVQNVFTCLKRQEESNGTSRNTESLTRTNAPTEICHFSFTRYDATR